jgi:hypothetical protein
MDMQNGILYMILYDNPIPKVGYTPERGFIFCFGKSFRTDFGIPKMRPGASQCPVLGSNLSTELRTFEADNGDIMGKITNGDL